MPYLPTGSAIGTYLPQFPGRPFYIVLFSLVNPSPAEIFPAYFLSRRGLGESAVYVCVGEALEAGQRFLPESWN